MRTVGIGLINLSLSTLALGACAFGGPAVGDERRGAFFGEPDWAYDYYEEGEYESSQGTLLVVTDAGVGGHLVGSIGAVRDLDHDAEVQVEGFGGSARVTMTVARTSDGPAMAIFWLNGDLRALIEAAEVTVDPQDGSETRPYTAAVTGCWTPGWSRESSTEQVAVTAVADPGTQTIDLVFTARFRDNDGEVVGHAVLAYAEESTDDVYGRGYR